MKLSHSEMRLAIHQTHNCEAKHCIEVTKVEIDQGGTADGIDVYTFEIEGHPSASRCFSWGTQKSSNRITVPAMLMTLEVRTASDAVKYYQARSGKKQHPVGI